MSLNRRKKSIKFRGDHTHGYGSKKKHRGSGHQGGVGMAGTGKKADQKKTKVWKDVKYFGRHGFASKTNLNIKGINIFYFETHLDDSVKSGLVKKESDTYNIDLKDFKCNKLLGFGTVTKKYVVKTDYASAAAVEKLAAKGGKVLLTHPKE